MNNTSSNQAKAFWRATTARVLGTALQENPEDIICRHWGSNESVLRLTRAATTPDTTTTAQALAAIGTYGVLPILAPASAAAALDADCLQINFGNASTVVIPKINTAPVAQWTAEGSASAMVQPVYSSIVVGPLKKILFGAAVTVELQQYAIETATSIVQTALTDAALIALDGAVLDNSAASASRPAGLLAGVSDLGATAGGGVAALVADLGKIAGAMNTAKIASTGLILFMNGTDAIRARGLLSPTFSASYKIVATPAVAAGSIVGVAPRAIAASFGVPQVEISTDGLVHMADDAHDNIDSTAVSETVKSAWQAGLLLLKCRMRCQWASLQSGAVQLVSSVTW